MIDAYALIVDGSVKGIMQMPIWFYQFSYAATKSDFWLRHISGEWRNFAVYDITRNEYICGQNKV